jgi:two-component system nitrate/nitrite response regulator NarL
LDDIHTMKLLVIDDHPVFRDGLTALLRQTDANTTVLQARDSAEGIQLVEQHDDLDAVFVDLLMPGMGGEATVRELAHRRPDLPVIVLAGSENPRDVRRALGAGALGYVPKSANPQTLLAALRLVLTGNIYVPPFLVQAPEVRGDEIPAPHNPNAIEHLTERQIQVLKLLQEGLSNKEIGARLGIAEEAVKAQVAAIFRALNVVNRTQAANAVRELKLA